jgi:hypothetical protein
MLLGLANLSNLSHQIAAQAFLTCTLNLKHVAHCFFIHHLPPRQPHPPGAAHIEVADQ